MTDREKGIGSDHKHGTRGLTLCYQFYFLMSFICFSVLGIELRALQLLRKSLAWLQHQTLTHTNDCSSNTRGSMAPLIRILVQWTIWEWMNAVEFVTALIRNQYSSVCTHVHPCAIVTSSSSWCSIACSGTCCVRKMTLNFWSVSIS